MTLRKTYCINEWLHWDDELYLSIVVFYTEFNVYPHILLCNDVTYGMIDMVAHSSPDNLSHKSGRQPEPDEFIELGCFDSDLYTLDFCLDSDLRDGYYTLVVDTHPEVVESDIP